MNKYTQIMTLWHGRFADYLSIIEKYKNGAWICWDCKTITPMKLTHCEVCGTLDPEKKMDTRFK